MDGSTTITVRVPSEVKKRLGKLAKTTDRTKSYLVAKAIVDYVAYEEEIIAGIKRGLADVKAGRVTPHNKVMDEIDALIDSIERRKKR